MIRDSKTAGKKKGHENAPFCGQPKELTVVDVHGHFKTETHVVVSWCFPFHLYTLQRFCCCELA